jgi:hypothetical protein
MQLLGCFATSGMMRRSTQCAGLPSHASRRMLKDLKIIMIVQLDHERGPWKATQSCGGLGSRQIGAPQQMGNRGGRLVDQKLLVAIEHFIAHRSDERVSLALAVRAQGAQPL